MIVWVILTLLILVSFVSLLWLSDRQTKEGFGFFKDQTTQFTNLQKTIFHDQADRQILINPGSEKNPGISLSDINGAFQQPDFYLPKSKDRDYSVYFREDKNMFTDADMKLCQNALQPKDIRRAPRASVGCGWWYVADPESPSIGAIGHRYQALDRNVDKYPGGKWVWNLTEAQRLEDLKKCKRIRECNAISAIGIAGECGFCDEKGHGVPINTDGTLKYPTEEDGSCTRTTITTYTSCPRISDIVQQSIANQISAGIGGTDSVQFDENGNPIGISASIQYDANGNPIPGTGVVGIAGSAGSAGSSGVGAGTGVAGSVRAVCDPIQGKLSGECLISLAKSLGMTESGAIIKMIRSGSWVNPGQVDKIAIDYMKQNVNIPITNAVLGEGSIDVPSASSLYSRIVQTMNTGQTILIKEAAKWLAVGTRTFDICNLNDSDVGPFPPDCLDREFRKAGCQPSGLSAPTDPSKYGSYTWSQIKSSFRDLYEKMKSPNYVEQDQAIKDCLGITQYREEPRQCLESGIEYITYALNNDNSFGGVLGRFISKKGFIPEYGDSTTGHAQSESRRLIDATTNKKGGVVIRTKINPSSSTNPEIIGTYSPRSVASDGDVVMDVKLNSTLVPVRHTGSYDILYGFSYVLPLKYKRTNIIEIQWKTIGSRRYQLYDFFPKLKEGTADINDFQLLQESWKPLIALDYFRQDVIANSNRDYNNTVTIVPTNTVSNMISRKRCVALGGNTPRKSIRISGGVHSNAISTITCMINFDDYGQSNSWWDYLPIISISGTTARSPSLTLSLNSSTSTNAMQASILAYSGTTPVSTSVNTSLTNIPKNRWNHIAITFHSDKSGIDLYVNGQIVGSKRLTTPVNGMFDSFTIGSVSNNNPTFNMAWCHIYDYPLSKEEILRDMNYDTAEYTMTVPEFKPYIPNSQIITVTTSSILDDIPNVPWITKQIRVDETVVYLNIELSARSYLNNILTLNAGGSVSYANIYMNNDLFYLEKRVQLNGTPFDPTINPLKRVVLLDPQGKGISVNVEYARQDSVWYTFNIVDPVN